MWAILGLHTEGCSFSFQIFADAYALKSRAIYITADGMQNIHGGYSE